MSLPNNARTAHTVKVCAAFLLPLLLVALIFFLTYRLDNKYAPSSGEIQALADGWEYYPGELLTPEELATGHEEAQTIYIGQFGMFAAGKGDTPFGGATYRKVLELPENSEGWMLELPEVYSACRVYVNGELMREVGKLGEDGQAKTQNLLIPLPSGQVDFVVNVTNFTHYYSGMIYPPLLGSGEALVEKTAGQMIFYALLSFFTLGGAAASVAFWLRRRGHRVFLLYGMLCLFFSLHMLYPFVHWLGWSAGELFYVLEDVLGFAQLCCLALLTAELTRRWVPRWIHISVYTACGMMLVLPVLCTYVVFPLVPGAVLIYGQVTAGFKILLSLYLMGASAYAALRGGETLGLLAGNAVFGFGVLADFWTAGAYEPIRFGWQDEYCGFAVVLLFTVLVVRFGSRVIRENERLTAHLQEEVDRKTQRLADMLEERRQFLSAVAHDLKAPAAVIRTYVRQLGEGQPDRETAAQWLKVVQRKAVQMQENVQSLQVFNAEDRSQEPMQELDFAAFLQAFYEETKPYADANGIYYTLEPTEERSVCRCQPKRLFHALENIVLNATEHTPLEGALSIRTSVCGQELNLFIADTGVGIVPEHLARIFEYRFSTKEPGGLRGIGLYFTKVTIEEFGGTIGVQSVPGKGTEFRITLPCIVSAQNEKFMD